ncbi:MAG: sulfite exporter TauE/SafE family protein, partial [Pseudomonadota bacterium]
LFFALGLLILGGQRLLSNRQVDAQENMRLPGPWGQRFMAGTTGIISSMMGIGGGVLGVLLLTRAGKSIHNAVGTAAGFGVAIALPGALAFMILGMGQTSVTGAIGFVSIPAFLAVSLGTAITAPQGARLASKLSPTLLSKLFAGYVTITGILMLREVMVG